MGLITVHSDLVSTRLPAAVPYAQTIAARPALRSWWRVQSSRVALASSAITQIDPVAGVAGVPLVQGGGANRPGFVEAVFGGRFPAAVFDGSDDVLTTASLPYVRTGLFTWAFIGWMSLPLASSVIARAYGSAGNATVLQQAVSGEVSFQHGNATLALAPPAGSTFFGAPLLILGASTTTQIKLRVNATRAAPTATNNSQTGDNFALGAATTAGAQPSPLRLAEFMIFQEDVFADAAFEETIAAYARRNYGIPA